MMTGIVIMVMFDDADGGDADVVMLMVLVVMIGVMVIVMVVLMVVVVMIRMVTEMMIENHFLRVV